MGRKEPEKVVLDDIKRYRRIEVTSNKTHGRRAVRQAIYIVCGTLVRIKCLLVVALLGRQTGQNLFHTLLSYVDCTTS